MFINGAGGRHPLVRELHQRLTVIDYLGFTDPGDDLFTEATRKAVVTFQESHGLSPNGEVNPATWVLLANPRPPVPTPTHLPPSADGGPHPDDPDMDNLPTHTDSGQPMTAWPYCGSPRFIRFGELFFGESIQQWKARKG